jgi:hypothetical protein
MPVMNTAVRFLGPALLLTSALLAACGGGGGSDGTASPPPASAPPSVERDVLPASTDAAIDTDLDSHFAVNPAPAVAARQRLFVFMPGTFGKPQNVRAIIREAAASGLHAIGLNYPNNATVGSLCSGSADANCHGNVRTEILTGDDTTSLVSITRANSIENRLIKLLQALHSQAPTEGWNTYLTGAGQPDWPRIRVAGHSQGGGHAGVIAKRYAVDRAIYFSAPADAVAGQPAAWMSAVGVTPGTRQAGFAHQRDELVSLAQIGAAWQTLGLTGALTSVDGATAPFGSARQLTTGAAANPGGTAQAPLHGSTVVDDVTPRGTDGTPLFVPVWRYLAFD